MEQQELKSFTRFMQALGVIAIVIMGIVTMYKIAEPIVIYNERMSELNIADMQQLYCPYCGNRLEGE